MAIAFFSWSLTLAQAGEFALLPRLKDVDLPEDIPMRISVVIPALNETADIARCLQSTDMHLEKMIHLAKRA